MNRPHPSLERIERILRWRVARLGLRDYAAKPQGKLRAFQAFLKFGEQIVKCAHRRGCSGRQVGAMRSLLIDLVIQTVFRQTVKAWEMENGRTQTKVSVLALGGYGRSELCPLSDVDILFVYPERIRSPNFPAQQRFYNDTVLYMLWDLNLKVGHSTRNITEAKEEARQEAQSKNAMLEARFICGSKDLGKAFIDSYERFIRRERSALFIQARFKDQEERRKKHGNTIFLQEPDLKNGVGGLRDFQNIIWIARLETKSSEVAQVLGRDFLTPEEFDAFEEAYDFILRVRNELHFQSKRPTDVLSLEVQPTVAYELGYHESEVFERVERFMRDYYQAARAISRMAKYLERRMAINATTRISFASVLASRREQAKEVVDGFLISNNYLECENPKIFIEDPKRLIRVFRLRQQYGVQLDLELSRLVERSVYLIDDKLRQSVEANRTFRSILQTRGDVSDTLRSMHRSGVLGAFIPEWSELDCLVQHEHYHRYTADEHTLTTMEMLDQIFRREEAETTDQYWKALEGTDLPALLYLVIFLHDIGKGREDKSHSEVGAEIAEPIVRRMGVAEGAIKKILFLIRNHLEMARFWQHFDLDDSRTIRKFVEFVGDAETLRYLYVLTYCDARGTSEELWNNYKDTLHTQLYEAARTQLGVGEGKRSHRMISKETLMKRIPDLSEEEVDAHFNLLPERYFVYSNLEEVSLHIEMVHRLLKTIAEADSMGSLVPVVDWHEDANLGLTVVDVVTWDRSGLFFKLAGAFAVAGLNIVSSKALSRGDHITLDTFYVSNASGGVVTDTGAKALFERALEDVLINGRNLLPDIEKHADLRKKPSYLKTRQEHLKVPLPAGVDVYHELSLKRTIIEVHSSDEIGLLYRLGKAIFDHGFDITFARISTERNVAVDTFYIEAIDKNSAIDSLDLMELRKSLTEIVESISADQIEV